MKLLILPLATSLALAAMPATARNNPESQLIGVWTTSAAVQPCGNSGPLPPLTPINVLTFHAGGTLTETTLFPPGGVPNVYGVLGLNTRGDGTGIWGYVSWHRDYMLSLRFNWFVDGVYNGYQVVDRTMTLDPTGQHISGSVQTTRYGVNGKVLASLCGQATSDRAL
ncbi:MAG: hypothetical protein JSR65_00415 [Proteobacteria bacterium]|nr:hypothetical protein [Pseudomonadota bacterium]